MKYAARIARLSERKILQTREKLSKLGPRDEDDYGWVLPPEDFHADLPVRDKDGSFAGARAWGKNFRWLMENHPVYIDPDDALAGRWMFMLSRMRQGYKLHRSNFAFDYSFLVPLQEKYDITSGIGKDAHFAPDYEIGLKEGWGGLLEKAKKALAKFGSDPVAKELFEAEVDAIEGIRCWIGHLASAARDRTMTEPEEDLRENLREMSRICFKLIDSPPETLREVCQWLAIFNMASRTYNRDGAGGQLDELLRPYYERDKAAGLIDDEDAEFYILCLLLNDPHYYQLGGPDENGRDMTSPVSFLILDAADKLKSSCNLTIRVHDALDKNLFRKGVEILLKNKLGYPRFSGDKALVAGFMKNGYDASLARKRIATGCNWMSLPGLEYTLNDVVKINIAKVFEVAFHETVSEKSPSLEKLEENYVRHFRKAVETVLKGIDFHLEHQYLNEPELLLNLLSRGPLEKGLDISHGGAQYYNMALDGAGLAVVADSFAAIQQFVVETPRISWEDLARHLREDFRGENGESVRKMLLSADKFGQGNSRGDLWAKKLTDILIREVGGKCTPGGRKMIPGWFSWADTIRFGKAVGATPNGRHAHAAISHGANPNPGFRKDGALTAMAKAIASVQPGFGNTAPWQLELDMGYAQSDQAAEKLMALMEAHFELGGTLININIVDAEKILDAHKHPELYPDLLVRVTGFSAYFTSLSQDFRQLVVNRLIREAL
ncbi:MAG: formate acetyltransferase [Lentisphaeria bacterium]|nr:formate acetyltransferase [Lentisphaeria bacterium]